jgi:hypothetical protein
MVMVIVMVLVNSNNLFLACSPFGAKEKAKTTSGSQQNQDNHSNDNRRAATTTGVILAAVRGTVDTLEADLETKLGLGTSGLQHALRH